MEDKLQKVLDEHCDWTPKRIEGLKKELLNLFSVSQQRELLGAFITWYNAKPKAKKGELIYVNDIIEFLKP